MSFPKAGPGESQVDASVAGRIGSGIAVVVEPIGFNRDIALSLIPALAAREVAVSSLGTIYAVEADDEDVVAAEVTERIAAGWTLPTALAFLAWFVFAPQCLSTIAVAKRETNGWRWPAFMVAYLFGLAYIFAGNNLLERAGPGIVTGAIAALCFIDGECEWRAASTKSSSWAIWAPTRR